MRSPPPAGLKSEVLIFRSVNNIVIAPARTGKERSNNKAGITTDQTNKVIPMNRILITVGIKLKKFLLNAKKN